MEVNPSLKDPDSVARTVAIGCSITRASLGRSSNSKGSFRKSFADIFYRLMYAGETLL
jgi:hypothetical protein